MKVDEHFFVQRIGPERLGEFFLGHKQKNNIFGSNSQDLDTGSDFSEVHDKRVGINENSRVERP
jgi:hypothetical protein